MINIQEGLPRADLVVGKKLFSETWKHAAEVGEII